MSKPGHTGAMEKIAILIGQIGCGHLLLISASFLLAGAVKGLSGLGLPTVAIGLLSLVMAPAQAAALLIVPSLATNLWQMMAGPDLPGLIRRLRSMLVGICIGTWLAGWLMAGVDLAWTACALGIALVAYATLGLASVHWTVPAGQEKSWSPVIGALTGCATAVTGVFVLPAVPYLQGLALNKDELVQAMGLAFTCSTLALAVNLAGSGQFHSNTAGMSCYAVLPAWLGMYAGQWLRGKISLTTFRTVFFSSLLLLGAHLAIKPLI